MKTFLIILLLAGCQREPAAPNEPTINVALKNEGMLMGCDSLLFDANAGTVKPDCQMVYDEFVYARERYSAEVDPTARNIKMGEAIWFAAKVVGVDSRGVPVMEYMNGLPVQAYFDNSGPTIVWANPRAIDCEVYHFLHWRLHRIDERPPGAKGETNWRFNWEVIGHNVDGDPMHFPCNLEAVAQTLGAAS